jgi:protein-tyrosine phosphatase
MIARIDVHSHLLPGIDDGCANLEQSLTCAQSLVRAGYTHAFCTPHIWRNLPWNTAETVEQRTAELQAHLDAMNVPLRVMPGGELTLRPELVETPPEQVVTYGLARKYCLFDIWADQLPDFFEPTVRHLQSQGLTLVLAHPERMEAVQKDPGLIAYFQNLGLLLQGNLQCFADPEGSPTRQLVERFLHEGQYTFLATDTHKPDTLMPRHQGLKRAVELVGEGAIARLLE